MLSRLLSRLRFRAAILPWPWLPAPVWALVASPVLWWAFGCRGRVFMWPCLRSRSPFRLSFWWEGRGL